jgi:hypothetical protein
MALALVGCQPILTGQLGALRLVRRTEFEGAGGSCHRKSSRSLYIWPMFRLIRVRSAQTGNGIADWIRRLFLHPIPLPILVVTRRTPLVPRELSPLGALRVWTWGLDLGERGLFAHVTKRSL